MACPECHGGFGSDDEEDETDSEDEEHLKVSRTRGITFDEVIAQERQLLTEKFLGRGEWSSTPGFSVAFSGGGMRAASFEAGVLWRLAQSGHLKEVEYLSADSGGTYAAAAFASHVLSAGSPPPNSDTDAWYVDLVAEWLSRMQRNMPYLARDLFKEPFTTPRDGSSCLPRAMDVPILMVVIAFTILFNPLWALICFLVPFTEMTNLLVGGAMRRALCGEGESAIWTLAYGFFALLQLFACTFVIYMLGITMCRRCGAHGTLCAQSAVSALIRLTFGVGLLNLVFGCMLASQLGHYSITEDGRQFVNASCAKYALELALTPRYACDEFTPVLEWNFTSRPFYINTANLRKFHFNATFGHFNLSLAEGPHFFFKSSHLRHVRGGSPRQPRSHANFSALSAGRKAAHREIRLVEKSLTSGDDEVRKRWEELWRWEDEIWQKQNEQAQHWHSEMQRQWEEEQEGEKSQEKLRRRQEEEARRFEAEMRQRWEQERWQAAQERMEEDKRRQEEARQKAYESIFKGPVVAPRLIPLLPFFAVGLLVGSITLMPFCPRILSFGMHMLGPLIVICSVFNVLRWRIFGPLLNEQLIQGFGRFDHETWGLFVKGCIICAMALRPFYAQLHRSMHSYYGYCLRRAFFADGKDKSWGAVKSNPYCPFLVFNATVNDYMRPGDDSPISEIFFSCLHVGGERTGYKRTKPRGSLARSMCLSGAATDAYILSLKDQIRHRFWLEMLNLCMGDWIIFEREDDPGNKLVRACVSCLQLKGEDADNFRTFLYNLPTWLVWEALYAMLLTGMVVMDNLDFDAVTCGVARGLLFTTACLVCTWVAISFFGFLPWVDFVLRSPAIRQLQRATRFYLTADVPPSLIYVTDGGVMDGLGVLQLLRRRCQRILCVIAEEDPDDLLAGLRKALDIAAAEQLASFYDPKDPQLDIRVVLDEYREDGRLSFMHLAIRYGWQRSAPPGPPGHLFIVKIRVPQDLELPMAPLLTKDIVRCEEDCEEPSDGLPFPEEFDQTDLGGCCCDCCHVNGCNVGQKFPHVPIANQCLTPQLFNSLCRLGYLISEEAIEAISAAGR